jgi:hypothetical protein
MHRAHLAWRLEDHLWRDELALWEREADQAIKDVPHIEKRLRDHADALRQHAASIRLYEQEPAYHEHELADYERGEAPSDSGADGGTVVEKMREGSGNLGFDAARNIYVDLIEAGIVDPTKVVRFALENAVSVAGTLLRTEATMTEIPDEKTLAGHGAPYEGE